MQGVRGAIRSGGDSGAELTGPDGPAGRVSGVFRISGQQAAKRDAAAAGEVAGLGKLDAARTGQTLATGKAAPAQIATLSPPEPVLSMAVASSERKDEVKLSTALAKILEEENIQYASKLSYHQMCRWNSGMFYKHPALEKYRYYWRIEPKVQFFCNVDYDVFRYMEDNNKTYGFTINLYDAPQTIKTLWPETRKFLAANPSYLSKNNMWEWLTDDQARPEHNQGANGYSTCHFWSNFEIGDLDFFRGEKYESYFQHLDRAGGFFYERWGDAPVHSIGVGLFADAANVHW